MTGLEGKATERFLDALHAAGCPPRKSGRGWSARCPAHEDRKPSLSVTPIEGMVLVYCHAGCDTDAVLAALRLARRDLYDSVSGATYRYDSGRYVHRTPDKDFWQSGNTDKFELYRLTRVKQGVASGAVVYLVEGEKDVHALEALGAIATTAPGGWQNISKVDVSPLKGARVVAVVDRDGSGAKWAVIVRERLDGYAAELTLVEAKEGKDAADHIAAGHGLGDFTPFEFAAESDRPAAVPVTPALNDDFWSARPYLKSIREAAHARQRSAPAVLGVVLARAAAMVDHRIRIPAIVGSDSGISVLVAIIAPSGVGKSSANAIGAELLPPPVDLDMPDQLPIGSGEGLIEAFFDMVEEENDQGKKTKVKKLVRHNALVYVDEGQVLGEIGNRRGATLLPTLRSIFSGSTLGQQNASEERRRILPARQYTIGVVVSLQTTLASALLEDAAGGTPQRLLWLPAADPTIPDDLPPWPGRLPWTPPDTTRIVGLDSEGYALVDDGPVYLNVAESIRTEIRLADRQRARGEVEVAELDAHAGLVRLKVAALLGLLEGRLSITEQDWALAGQIKAASDATRATVETAVKEESAKKARQRSQVLADQAVHQDVAVRRRRIVDCARKTAAKVWADPEKWTRKDLFIAMRRYRAEFDDALEHAIGEGWLAEVSQDGQGDARRLLRPGTRRPS